MSEYTAHRAVRYRLFPGSRERANGLAQLAGASRFVSNTILADQEQLVESARLAGATLPPVSRKSLYAAFKQLRDATPWLQELPSKVIRYVLHYQALAWKNHFTNPEKFGRPKFKRRLDNRDAFTLPDCPAVENGRIWIPNPKRGPKRFGWFKISRRGGNPYPDGEPLTATVKREGERWYVVVTYRVTLRPRPDAGKVMGLDRNTKNVATFDGERALLHRIPDTSRLERLLKIRQQKAARCEKGSGRHKRALALCRRTERRIVNRRQDWRHRITRRISDRATTVAVEALNVSSMTSSASGTVEQPGVNVAQKRGLNRVILRVGWSELKRMLEYKAGRVIEVPAAYTSQACSACGHVSPKNREKDAPFGCVRCGHEDDADLNAARNIRQLALGSRVTVLPSGERVLASSGTSTGARGGAGREPAALKREDDARTAA